MKPFGFITALFLTASSLFAQVDTYYDYARVTKSEPIYEYVYERIPKEECVEEKVAIARHRSFYNESNSIGLDTIIGATTGVVIGNQIGKGNGRTAAKIIGGIVGGAIANNMREPKSYSNQGHDYEIRTRCYDRSTSVKRKMITGYRNYFVYNGQEHFKVSNKPKKRVRITHTIDF